MKAEIERLKGIVENNYPEKRTDLVKARFRDWEWWTPPPPRDKHPIQRKLQSVPGGYIDGKIYSIPLADVESNPWWIRVTP